MNGGKGWSQQSNIMRGGVIFLFLTAPGSLRATTELSFSQSSAKDGVPEIVLLASFAMKMLGSRFAEFTSTLVGATLLAGLCWWAASKYSSLWNLRYRVTLGHHVLCLLAALLTLTFVMLFASLRYAREAAEASIDLWRLQIFNDAPWANQTFRTAYGAVQSLGVEDFSQYPSPEMGGNMIPQTKPETISMAASVYANRAAANFRLCRPLLSKILSVRPEVPREAVSQAVEDFFAAGGKTYQLQGAIDIATAEIKGTLQPQTGRVVLLGRSGLIALFLLVQSIPFGWIGFAAYNDLKVST